MYRKEKCIVKRNKPKFWDKVRYQFDNLMSKGTIALVAMLFLITAIVVVVSGALGAVANKELTTGNSIWLSLMHAIDAGTLAGDDTTHLWFVVLMSIVTICGIFVTSILIGIISTGFENKLSDLRKGTSKVIETGHTVVIGFNDSIYTILSELIEAGENQKRPCIVVLGEEEKEVMEESIKGRIMDFKTTRVICKSGKLTESYLLERAALETCKSIIINQEDDFSVIKIILATVNYLKSKDAFEQNLHITTMIHDQKNLDAAKMAGEGKAEVLFFEDALSRIMAHTCRQPGLSMVLTEFFDFGGDEFYFENFKELAGKTFGEVLNLFENSTVVGLKKQGRVMLNPPMDTEISAEDMIIHLAEDDDTSKPSSQIPKLDLSIMASAKNNVGDNKKHLLVLGYNHFLPDILSEMDNYAEPDSVITVADVELPVDFDIKKSYQNIVVVTKECDIYNRNELELLIQKTTDDILLLSNLEVEADESDAKTLLILIQLRDIANRWNREFNITSEMCSVSNQELAKVANVNDFVVGSTITNLIITQVSENRELALLFDDLLDADGSELYMKKASRYVQTGVETDFYTITEIAARRCEIVVGYKKMSCNGIEIITNPKKTDRITFNEEDYLIVIAEDNT